MLSQTICIKNTIKKSKLFSNLNKKCFYFQKNLNQFIKKEKIEAKVYRFDSIMRIVFSKKEINNRMQRDFFEKKNTSNIVKFKKYLYDYLYASTTEQSLLILFYMF